MRVRVCVRVHVCLRVRARVRVHVHVHAQRELTGIVDPSCERYSISSEFEPMLTHARTSTMSCRSPETYGKLLGAWPS